MQKLSGDLKLHYNMNSHFYELYTFMDLYNVYKPNTCQHVPCAAIIKIN